MSNLPDNTSEELDELLLQFKIDLMEYPNEDTQPVEDKFKQAINTLITNRENAARIDEKNRVESVFKNTIGDIIYQYRDKLKHKYLRISLLEEAILKFDSELSPKPLEATNE